MADITKCVNKKCKIKDTCYRFTAPDGYYQSYAEFNKDKTIKNKKECEHYLWGKSKKDR